MTEDFWTHYPKLSVPLNSLIGAVVVSKGDGFLKLEKGSKKYVLLACGYEDPSEAHFTAIDESSSRGEGE